MTGKQHAIIQRIGSVYARRTRAHSFALSTVAGLGRGMYEDRVRRYDAALARLVLALARDIEGDN